MLAIVVTTAMAWDGTVSGKIAEIDGVGGAGGAPGNYDVRVHLQGQAVICPGAIDTSWGYINIDDPNYKALLALLLIAQSSGETVTLYTNKSSSGYCQIGYVNVKS
jgi:hypothetical protein